MTQFKAYLDGYTTKGRDLATVESAFAQGGREAARDIKAEWRQGSGLARFTTAVSRLASVGIDLAVVPNIEDLPEGTLLSIGGDAE